ncbi:MAG: restriction endonuclease subunit S [Rhodospirillaceae bacterium]|nr:MAG: restriction endonuclease subunit S [Rhodospirillaceae bacterium]
MDEWAQPTFLEAPIEIIDGDRGVNYPKQAEFAPSGHCLFLNAGNVSSTGFKFSECSFISEERDNLLRKGKLKRYDSVLTTRGTVGNVAFYDDSIPFDHVRINSGMVIFRPDQPTIVPRYLYLFLRSRLFRNQVSALTTGSAQPQLPIRDIHRIHIPLPSISEQHNIAETLGSLDDKIELNRRMNETLEAMARAIFKDWFVDFGPTRAKAEGREPYLAPDIWGLFPDALDDDDKPVGWELGCLADVAESPRRGISPTDVSEETPYIGLEHMPRRSIALTEWEGAGKVTSNKSVFKRGEFLFGKLRPYFHKVGVAPLSGICSTDIVVLTPRTADWSVFVLACISTDEFIAYTNQASTGTKMPRTSWKAMGQYGLCLPPELVICAFQNTVQPMIDRIIANIHESRTLVQTRDLLLPKLMSGKIRLREAEDAVEAVA